MRTKSSITLLWLVAVTVANADPTAFSLIKEGDRYIGEQSKDNVVAIHSDRSAGALAPNIWYITYYDPDAPLKAVEVKFGGGQKMDVSRPFRLLEPVTGNDRVLDRDKLKVDSDRALSIAKSESLVKDLDLTSSQLWLEHGATGPTWKIKLWAAKVKNPSHQADIGEIYISADDGSVVKSNLHPSSIN